MDDECYGLWGFFFTQNDNNLRLPRRLMRLLDELDRTGNGAQDKRGTPNRHSNKNEFAFAILISWQRIVGVACFDRALIEMCDKDVLM